MKLSTFAVPLSHLSVPVAAGLLSSCMLVGPDHSVPTMEMAESYKTSSALYASRIDKDWWKTFGDSKLNSLMSDLNGDNFDLRAAESRRKQAYAALGVDRSLLYPQVASGGSVTRNRRSESDNFGGGGGGGMQIYYDQYRASMSLGYEIDLWGRVRRLVEAGVADAQAAELMVHQVKLSLQSQLASNYFAMRFLDSEAEVLKQALSTRQESLDLTRDLFDAGKSSELDVARAEAQLASAKAQLVALQGPRASLENSIAVLVGKNASNFSIPQKAISGSPSAVSAGTPATLLGRRPDVFIAERELAATSARIGVSEANFYPKISLIGTGGFSSIDSSSFLKYSSGEFSIGPEIELPLFQGLRRDADLELAKANHEEALAKYQQTVLQAFADVESALASRRAALNEIAAQQDSVAASKKAFDLSNTRYTEGVANYLEVIDSQREMLNAQLSEVQARGRSFAATVQLIQALGGGFSQ